MDIHSVIARLEEALADEHSWEQIDDDDVRALIAHVRSQLSESAE